MVHCKELQCENALHCAFFEHAKCGLAKDQRSEFGEASGAFPREDDILAIIHVKFEQIGEA